jgi:hypothetical protein
MSHLGRPHCPLSFPESLGSLAAFVLDEKGLAIWVPFSMARVSYGTPMQLRRLRFDLSHAFGWPVTWDRVGQAAEPPQFERNGEAREDATLPAARLSRHGSTMVVAVIPNSTRETTFRNLNQFPYPFSERLAMPWQYVASDVARTLQHANGLVDLALLD